MYSFLYVNHTSVKWLYYKDNIKTFKNCELYFSQLAFYLGNYFSPEWPYSVQGADSQSQGLSLLGLLFKHHDGLATVDLWQIT